MPNILQIFVLIIMALKKCQPSPNEWIAAYLIEITDLNTDNGSIRFELNNSWLPLQSKLVKKQ